MAQVPHGKIGSLFAKSRLNRRQALQRSAVGVAAAGLAATGAKAATAQEATPDAGMDVAASSSKEFLFVQSFESGTIVPKDGADGTYTVTLQHGLGHTVYFSDRPERIVGAAPTGTFLDGLGFSAENPPNAALVVGSADGGTDIAVVELTNPTYDEASATATYDVAVLKDYEVDVDMHFEQSPADLASLASSFGSAQLLIDDCANQECWCWSVKDPNWEGDIGQHGFCWNSKYWKCEVCNPEQVEAICQQQYTDYCNANYECGLNCPT